MFAVFSIPTREARIFAGLKPRQVSKAYEKYDNDLQEVCDDFNTCGFMNEVIDHYAVLKIKA
jgi:hypothetical protein